MSGLLYADDLVLCGRSEEELRAMVEIFEVCRRRGLKVSADKSKGMALGGDEGLEHMSEFKRLGFVFLRIT